MQPNHLSSPSRLQHCVALSSAEALLNCEGQHFDLLYKCESEKIWKREWKINSTNFDKLNLTKHNCSWFQEVHFIHSTKLNPLKRIWSFKMYRRSASSRLGRIWWGWQSSSQYYRLMTEFMSKMCAGHLCQEGCSLQYNWSNIVA